MIQVRQMRLLFLTIACTCQIHARSSAPDKIPNSIENNLISAFEKGGTTAVKDAIVEALSKWKDTEINIGVTGNSGVGKSSFINAMRGLSPEDDGAAEVGVVETTMTMKKYQHPKNEKILFWDLPGIGTPNFPQENYLETIKAGEFDYFIIISSDRFTENDLWLGKEMERRRKAFYFVRSKVGQDIANNKMSHPNTHNTKKVLETIRENCKKNLQNVQSLGKPARVYLIDSYDVYQYDFGVLSNHLFEDAPDLKREAMLMSLRALSEDLILEKKKHLAGKIYYTAILAAAAGAAPVPGLDIAVDLSVILAQVIFYRSQFGLDEKSLTNYANRHGMSINELTTSAELESSMIEFTKTGIITYLSKIGFSSAASSAAKAFLKYIPIAGSIIGGTASYLSVSHCLNNILTMMVNDAMKLNSYDNQDAKN